MGIEATVEVAAGRPPDHQRGLQRNPHRQARPDTRRVGVSGQSDRRPRRRASEPPGGRHGELPRAPPTGTRVDGQAPRRAGTTPGETGDAEPDESARPTHRPPRFAGRLRDQHPQHRRGLFPPPGHRSRERQGGNGAAAIGGDPADRLGRPTKPEAVGTRPFWPVRSLRSSLATRPGKDYLPASRTAARTDAKTVYAEDTIAAIATPPGPGGIGIIRVSGPGAAAIANAVFNRPDLPDSGRRTASITAGS